MKQCRSFIKNNRHLRRYYKKCYPCSRNNVLPIFQVAHESVLVFFNPNDADKASIHLVYLDLNYKPLYSHLHYQAILEKGPGD